MATATVTNAFAPKATSDATTVNADFTDIVNFCNNELIHLDGSKTMTGYLNVPDPTTANGCATKLYVDLLAAVTFTGGGTQTGMMELYPYELSTGFLLCDGSLHDVASYGALYGVLGTRFGSWPTPYYPLYFGVPNIADPATGMNYFIKT